MKKKPKDITAQKHDACIDEKKRFLWNYLESAINPSPQITLMRDSDAPISVGGLKVQMRDWPDMIINQPQE